MQPEQPIPRTVDRVVLIGFMGAGKSTLGPILAHRLGWRFVDTDHMLEAEAGTTIASLFTTLGEPAFRRMEAEIVARLLGHSDLVIALGGGAIEIASTRTLLSNASNTCVIFLRAPLEVLIERCEQQPDAAVRPVLRQREALRQRFHSRLPHYQSAHLTVDTEGLDPHTIADHTLSQMLGASYAIPLHQKAITT